MSTDGTDFGAEGYGHVLSREERVKRDSMKTSAWEKQAAHGAAIIQQKPQPIVECRWYNLRETIDMTGNVPIITHTPIPKIVQVYRAPPPPTEKPKQTLFRHHVVDVEPGVDYEVVWVPQGYTVEMIENKIFGRDKIQYNARARDDFLDYLCDEVTKK